MANRDFLPHNNAELLAWSVNFNALINAAGALAAYGVSTSQATAYTALHNDFAAKLLISGEPVTRTRATIEATRLSRTPLKVSARNLARIINAFPAVTNVQRIALGLNPRAGELSPINPPEEQPVLEVVTAIGRMLKLKLRSIDSDRRGKPDGVDGANIFSFVGANPPADMGEWKFEGATTRASFDVEFPPATPAGSQVWLTACWFNPRSQTGPACQPIAAYIAGGVVGEAA